MNISVVLLEEIKAELPSALRERLEIAMQKARETHAKEEKKRRETHEIKCETHELKNGEIEPKTAISAEISGENHALGGERGGSFLNNSSVRTNGTLSTLTGTLFNKEKEKINKKEKKSCGSQKADKTELEKDFEVFWERYPLKKGRKPARIKFLAAFKACKGLTLNELLKALETQKQSEQWRKDSGRFIPHPTTWLNQERWTDKEASLPQAPQCEPASAPIASYALPSREPKHGFVDPKEFSEGLKKAIAEASK